MIGDRMRDVIPAPVPGLDLRREYGHHQSPAIRAGGLIFCSGMVAINPETGEREHGTVTSETRRIFENLKLLLESAGSSLDRIVQVHAMIYDRIEYDVLNRVYRQYVPNAPPARTVMSVQIEAGFKVMLDVIAAAETLLARQGGQGQCAGLFDAGIREHELGLSRVLPDRSAGADRLRRRAHWRLQSRDRMRRAGLSNGVRR